MKSCTAFVRMELLDVNVREAAVDYAAHCELCSAAACGRGGSRGRLGNRAADDVRRTDAAPRRGRFACGISQPPSSRFVETQSGMGECMELLRRWFCLFFYGRQDGAQKGSLRRLRREKSLPAPGARLDAKTAVSPAGCRRHRATAVSEDTPASGTYVASDFVPVPYTGAITSDDPGIIVRVFN